MKHDSSSGEAQEMDRVVGEEERCLGRVQEHVDRRRISGTGDRARELASYDRQLLELRDEIAAARLEDIPPLIEQMERLQGTVARRREVTEGFIDSRSPYFGRLVLQEGERKREVLIGRSTYLDTKSAIRIVDWRDAPVSRLFYRYDEGDDYCETFGERETEGEVLVRRSVVIVEGSLRRITSPQGQFAKTKSGGWKSLQTHATQLQGGQGSAARAEQHHRLGLLGNDDFEATDDKHLREITALIDPQQFELITRPDAGLVVIQGGAGSGKTTIGLHRLAYLAYQDRRRFRPDRMLVVVFNDALVRYISKVLPALDVAGVGIRTYQDWAARLRGTHLPALPSKYQEDTPPEVTRLKKHPAMLAAIDRWVQALADDYGSLLTQSADKHLDPAERDALQRAWRETRRRPLLHRLHAMNRLLGDRNRRWPTNFRVGLVRATERGMKTARDVLGAWADLLTDKTKLTQAFAVEHAAPLTPSDLQRAYEWCNLRCNEMLDELEQPLEEPDPKQPKGRGRHDERDDEDMSAGVDGLALDSRALLDREDDTLLLRLHQRLVGPLMRGSKGKEPLIYEHVLVDEAQDLSPIELAVVLDTVSRAQSVTLAGDVAQRLHMDNGFTGWKSVMEELGLSHVAVEPLRLSYRSAKPIIEFAHAVLGPLADPEMGKAVRDGVPVELFTFGHTGDAAAFVGERLRELMQEEPRCSVAVITRYAEQADLYYEGLEKAEVPHVRRIADQDFPFKPGVDVTDARQVKGLEFDYVILAEVTASSYPATDEARHLLHIAATRAAHQLWVIASGTPSPILPQAILDAAL